MGPLFPAISTQGLAGVEIPLLPPEQELMAKRAMELREEADADEEQAIREVEAWLS